MIKFTKACIILFLSGVCSIPSYSTPPIEEKITHEIQNGHGNKSVTGWWFDGNMAIKGNTSLSGILQFADGSKCGH